MADVQTPKQPQSVLATGPWPLLATPKASLQPGEEADQYIEVASEMVIAHNFILRGMNSIYLQADHVPRHELKNFIGYATCTFDIINEHHGNEEGHWFPAIEKALGQKGAMDKNVEDHRSFHDGLAEGAAYLASLRGHEQDFVGSKMKAIIEGFMPALHRHLNDEIPTLLALRSSEIPLQLLWNDGMKAIWDHINYSTTLSYVFFNHDRGYENGLFEDYPPKLPEIVRWILVWACSSWHWGYWKFASCDRNGHLKNLFAAK